MRDKKSSNDGSNFWLRRVFKPLGGGTSTSLQIDFRQWTHRDLNPQLRARGFFEPEVHPVSGTHELPGLPMRFSELERWYRTPAPTLGEHTEEVLRELLGLDDDAIAELRAERVIGTRPLGT